MRGEVGEDGRNRWDSSCRWKFVGAGGCGLTILTVLRENKSLGEGSRGFVDEMS